MIVSSYLEQVLDWDKFSFTINKTIPILHNICYCRNNTVLVVCGTSGILVGGCLSYKLGLQLVIVRKKGEPHHSEYKVEGESEFSRYVIVDDTIITGSTISHIVGSIATFNPKGVLEGIVLYGETEPEMIEKIKRRYGCWIRGTYGEN